MKNQTFGVEIEMTGLTRRRTAQVIASYFGTAYAFLGTGYDAYGAKDSEGRTWKAMRDSSIHTDGGEQVELVTPILKYNDIEALQEIIRRLRGAGAKVNSSCGIHIHIGAERHTPQTLRNLVNIVYSKQALIYKALGVDQSRMTYCKPLESDLTARFNSHKPNTSSAVADEWYKGYDCDRRAHYNNSRYHCLNLHSYFTKGTVEFRIFNSTLHAGKVKAYIQFCLAVNNQALTQRSASARITTTTNDKYTFRTWLLRLGLIGDEFATARKHLLANLDGDIAWRNSETA